MFNITYEQILDLIKVVSSSSLANFELEFEGAKIKIAKEGIACEPKLAETIKLPVTDKTSPREEISGEFIKSPIVGTFYSSSAPGKPPFVSVGKRVKKGDVVCIIEAMKVMNEVKSPLDGEVVEVLVSNEQMVEYNQPLFKVR